jgi:heterodisulfide reductase subunit B
MTLAYYPGCSLHGTSREFDESFRAVATALPIEMTEIDGWNCCGASSAHATDHLLGVALPARNLALAEAAGHDEVVAPCAACYNRLAGASHAVANEPGMAAKVAAVLDRPFANNVAIKSVVQVLLDRVPQIGERVAARTTPNPIVGLKIAAYYGCLLVRPAEITGFDDSEQPHTLEDVASACGATPVGWNMAVECCGGAWSIAHTSSVVRLGRAIIDDARKNGADAIVVACPLCHSNLDMRQAAMVRRGEEPLPVIYITELVGLALGLDAGEMGMGRHFVATEPLLAQLQAAAVTRAAEDAAKAAAAAEKAAAKAAAQPVAAAVAASADDDSASADDAAPAGGDA